MTGCPTSRRRTHITSTRRSSANWTLFETISLACGTSSTSRVSLYLVHYFPRMRYPAMGAVVAHEVGFRGGALPPYVAVPRNPMFTWELGKSAFLGGRYESFKAGDPNQP